MATVRLEISPTPAHVRTARLVAAAVARHSGIDEMLLDEIRLAVGEACSRAVGLHRMHSPHTLVHLELTDGPRFSVVVTDAVPRDLAPTELGLAGTMPDPVALVAASPAGTGSAEDAELAEDSIAAGVGLALLAGLVDDLEVRSTADGRGTAVRMSWPLASPPGPARSGGRTFL
jgi:anti-sigma regulatory factor (Ser/Thr protein kinase)